MGWNEVEKSNNNEKKNEYTKFPVGATMIRILDDEPYSFWQHWLNNQRTSVTCLGKDCPICNIINAARQNKEKSPYTNQHRHAMRVWNYTTNQQEIMIQSKGFMSNMLTLHKEIGDLRTYDVKVIRSGEGKETTYTLLPTSPSEFEFKDRIEDVDFEEVFKAPTREEMLQLIEGKTWAEIRGTDAA